MAKVFTEAGYTAHVWPDDHPPPHVHVFHAGTEVVIGLGSKEGGKPGILDARTMKVRHAKKALRLVKKHHDAAWRKWEEFHG